MNYGRIVYGASVMSTPAPIICIGCIRSGTTILADTLRDAYRSSIDFDDLDFEARTFWQQFGCWMGSAKSGTYCKGATADDATPELKKRIAEYVANRTSTGKHIVSKCPHLANKTSFVRAMLPNAKIIHIIRDCHGTAASTKLVMQSALKADPHYEVPFHSYWPDCERPCWSVIPVDPDNLPNYAPRKRLGGLIKRPRLMPGCLEHADTKAFHQEHTDASRYYPGEGFARIPESWVRLNHMIVTDLRDTPDDMKMTIHYHDFCDDPRGVVSRIAEFGGVTDVDLQAVPEQMDSSTRNKWKKNLSEAEQKSVNDVLRKFSSMVEEIQATVPQPLAGVV